MFEKFDIPAFFLSKDAVLACYACGRTSGLVIDVGASGTMISPVHDGWVDSKGLNRSVVGGRYMDAYVLSLLRSKRLDPLPLFRLVKSVTHDKRVVVTKNISLRNVHPSYDALMNLDIGRDLKESVCRMGDSAISDSDVRYTNIPSTPYELPDGTVLDLGYERFQVPELLCDPLPLEQETELAFLGMGSSKCTAFPASFQPVPRLVCDSILKCEPDTQSTLFSNLVITGT